MLQDPLADRHTRVISDEDEMTWSGQFKRSVGTVVVNVLRGQFKRSVGAYLSG